MGFQTVLLIDDDIDDQEIFKSAMNVVAPETHCFVWTNAQDALSELLERKLNPEIIFLDLNMPIMSGQEFLMKVKEDDRTRHIPVVIFSTSSNPTTIQLTKDIGATDFITKPDRFDKLVTILKPIISQ